MPFATDHTEIKSQTTQHSVIPKTSNNNSRDCSPTYEEWLAEIDRKMVDIRVDKSELLAKIMEKYERFDDQNDANIIRCIAQNLYILANLAEASGEKDHQKNFLIEGKKYMYIEKALAIDCENSIHHAWAAYILGKLSYFVGPKERIQLGHGVRHHLEEAIKLGTTEAGTYLAYGRLYLEAARLTWIERKLASIIFGEPPRATYQDALDKFMEADKLEPNWKVNYFYIGKVHICMKNFKGVSLLAPGRLNFHDMIVE